VARPAPLAVESVPRKSQHQNEHFKLIGSEVVGNSDALPLGKFGSTKTF